MLTESDFSQIQDYFLQKFPQWLRHLGMVGHTPYRGPPNTPPSSKSVGQPKDVCPPYLAILANLENLK